MADEKADQNPGEPENPLDAVADANTVSPVGWPEGGAAQGNLTGARPGEGISEADLTRADAAEVSGGPIGGASLEEDSGAAAGP
jgi:hypothetical protein